MPKQQPLNAPGQKLWQKWESPIGEHWRERSKTASKMYQLWTFSTISSMHEDQHIYIFFYSKHFLWFFIAFSTEQFWRKNWKVMGLEKVLKKKKSKNKFFINCCKYDFKQKKFFWFFNFSNCTLDCTLVQNVHFELLAQSFF